MCRVGGPIFFANADKFVDQLYSDVLRPTDVKQHLDVCVVVSDDRQEFDDDSRKLTNPNNVELSRLNSPNAAAGFDFTACGDAQGTPNDKSHEITDTNDTEEDRAPHQHHVDGGNVRLIVLDCSRMAFVDSMAVAALKKLIAAYRNVGVQLVLSCCDAKVTAVMSAACILGDTKTQIEIYPTVHDAVLAVR